MAAWLRGGRSDMLHNNSMNPKLQRILHLLAPRGAARVSPNAVYDNEGQVIGADPDPNVRQQLRRDHDAIE